jgi:hypothetical protein
MRKETVSPDAPQNLDVGDWLDLEQLTNVRLTSEDSAHPIEAALTRIGSGGWKAAAPGRQSITLEFDRPQNIREIHVCFEIPDERTQEFLLRWSADGGATYRDLVRQRFNFSPTTPREEERYQANLTAVTTLELSIMPDVAQNAAFASLASLRVRG